MMSAASELLFGRPVAIVGAGGIGTAWAIVFACGGAEVRVVDPDAKRLRALPEEMASRLEDLAGHGLIGEAADAIAARVVACATLVEATADAALVLESAPERLEAKIAIFHELEAAAPRDAILASSSSAICASAFAGDLATRDRCLVIHPANPPYLIKVVEISPAPFTSDLIVNRADAILRAVGMRPVRIRHEIEGFVFNRLQGAMLREAYCLVRDGAISAAELDLIVRDGLGLRWSVTGPFETADLNVRGGIAAHAARMGPAYARMGAERGQNDPWTDDLVASVAAERRALLPLDCWDERVRWRDRALMRLLTCRAASLDL